ncbi:MAG: TraB/GumN family protein [Lysobacteraceae bacterium]|nr:MAG: TraB/GumN family protein [Xanthomonadaceae bacterium]
MRVFKPIFAGLVVALTFASSANAASPKPAKAEAPPVPLLWKVSDADNDLYLLGSFHLLKTGDYPLSSDIDDAFADAEELVFELSPAEIGSPDLAMKMAQAAARTNGKALYTDLPPMTAAQLDEWASANVENLARIGLQPRLLQVFDAWFVGLTITIVEMGKQGLDPMLGLDRHMAGKAKDASKPTEGLELGAEQIAFFDAMSASEQLQFLDEALSMSSGDGAKEVETLHKAWREGDADALWRAMTQEMRKEYPQLYKRIIVARNDAWVPKLERRLKREGTADTLAVVGAAHLLGEDGVVEKLRAKGYTVERICSACPSDSKAGAK